MLDIREILNYLPHRYPFLLIDRVLELREGEYVKALKNVTANEAYFVGHFPQDPVMPGVLIIEALAQAGAIIPLHLMDPEERKRHLVFFGGIEKARFKRVVRPGDQLILEGSTIKKKGPLWKMEGTATVDGEVAVEAVLQAFVRKLE